MKLHPLLLALVAPGPLAAQGILPIDLDSLVYRLAAMSAVSGYEQAMADTVLTLLPRATRDRAGNVVLTLGQGSPRRLLVCPLDEPGFVVGQLREDGWLTLRRVGGAPSPLFDQQLEGQRVTVFGRRGPIPGVVAVRSIHLTRGRSGASETAFSADDAYLDIGARSAAEARAAGADVLSAVTLEKQPQAYGEDRFAAPVAGRRAACGALISAARIAPPGEGTTVVAFVVEHRFTRRGILTLGQSAGPFDHTWVVDGSAGEGRGSADMPPERFGAVERLSLATRYPGTPVETIRLPEAAVLEARLVHLISGGE